MANTGENDGHGFQIAPMVDVVFVLMLFFMACIGQHITEKFLSITPSGRPGPEDTQPVSIFVDVDGRGNVLVNNQPYSAGSTDHALPQLRQMLTESALSAPNDPVIIRPQDETRHERIMDVLDAYIAAKVRKITFAVR